MLQAIGVGARRSLPAAATINWVLKDGLGRLGRLSISTKFGGSFDADLKVENVPLARIRVCMHCSWNRRALVESLGTLRAPRH